MPLFAICAGTWRLTNAFGGKTKAVPEETVPYHEDWGPARHPDRTVYLKPGSMLQRIHVAAQRNKDIIFSSGIAQKQLGRATKPHTNFNPLLFSVNSTHWRVSPPPEVQLNTEFQRYFETSAIDVAYKTVEAYESKHGVPFIGVQFHPEYVIPQVRKKDGSSVTVTDFKTHRAILEALAESGLTYRRKHAVLKELTERYRVKSRLHARL